MLHAWKYGTWLKMTEPGMTDVRGVFDAGPYLRK